MPTVGPDRKPWPMTSIESGSPRSTLETAGLLLLALTFGYIGFGVVVGLPEWKISGVGLIFAGSSIVVFAVDILTIKDILPFGEYSPPDSLGAVIRMVSIAGVSVMLAAFGGAFIASGAMILLHNA